MYAEKLGCQYANTQEFQIYHMEYVDRLSLHFRYSFKNYNYSLNEWHSCLTKYKYLQVYPLKFILKVTLKKLEISTSEVCTLLAISLNKYVS